MPRFREGGTMGFISTNDLSAASNQNKIVKIDSSNAPTNIVLAAAGTDKSIGVLLDTPAAGQTGTVRLRNASGTLSVKLGGTVAVGDLVTSNGSGVAITTTTGGDQVLGIALQAGVSGDVIEILPSVSRV